MSAHFSYLEGIYITWQIKDVGSYFTCPGYRFSHFVSTEADDIITLCAQKLMMSCLLVKDAPLETANWFPLLFSLEVT